jgi:PAS domain S-box-containing protein
MAKKLGYYRDAGLDVEIREGNPQVDYVSEVISNRAQYGTGSAGILLSHQQGAPVVVLAVIFQHSPDALIVTTRSGIDSPQQLVRKRIMVSDSTPSVVPMLLNETGTLNHYVLIKQTNDLQGLIDGRLDAIAGYSTDQPFYYHSREFPIRVLYPIRYGVDFYGDNLFTSQQELELHPERVAAFRAASLKGWEYAMEHPDETISAIQQFGSKRSLDHLRFEYAAMLDLVMPDFVEMGYMNEGRWRHIADTYARRAQLSPNYNLDGFLYDPHLPSKLQYMRPYLRAAIALIFIGAAIIVALMLFNRRLAREITQRNSIEAKLRENEQRLQQALEAGCMAVWDYDLEHEKLYWSPEIFQMLESGVFEPDNEAFRKIVHPEDREGVFRAFDQALANKTAFSAEFRVVTESGNTRWVADFGQVRYAADGKPLRVIGIVQDISDRKEAERSLTESEARFRAQSQRLNEVIWGTHVGTWEWNIASGETIFNERWAEIVGHTLEELSPTTIDTWLRLAHPEDLRYSKGLLQRCFQGESDVYDCEVRMRHKDGHWVWIHDRGRVVEWARDGSPLRMAGTHMDISERKNTEAELERHRAHLEDLVRQRTAEFSSLFLALPDIYFRVNRQGLILDFRAGQKQDVSAPPDHFIGKRVQDVLPPPAAAEMTQAIATLNEHDSPAAVEYEITIGGQQKYFEARLIPLDTDQIIAVVRNISERKHLEQAREAALREAERLAQVKSEFLANMSHEIRTPLNGVLGMAQVGLRRSQGRTEASETFAKIIESGKLLLGVINDILDFSKLEAGKLKIDMQPVDLRALITETTELIRERADRKSIALATEFAEDFPRACITDPLRLGQILLNLLSNAVKFTDRGSITVTGSVLGDELEFRVCDTGIGMTQEDASRLFEAFEQADGTTTRRYGGTGLGLTITRRLVEALGGRIEVSSTLGSGSTFAARIPYAKAATPQPDHLPMEESATRDRLKGLSVLVAEDNAVNQLVLEDLLTLEGARVTMVGNGREALEAVRSGQCNFDIVLMDVQMPEMDGHEATRRILELYPKLPIIGQTAHAFGTERDACYLSGMVGHVAKPIDPDELVEAISRSLG